MCTHFVATSFFTNNYSGSTYFHVTKNGIFNFVSKVLICDYDSLSQNLRENNLVIGQEFVLSKPNMKGILEHREGYCSVLCYFIFDR